jgi:hypothetical protein
MKRQGLMDGWISGLMREMLNLLRSSSPQKSIHPFIQQSNF